MCSLTAGDLLSCFFMVSGGSYDSNRPMTAFQTVSSYIELVLDAHGALICLCSWLQIVQSKYQYRYVAIVLLYYFIIHLNCTIL